MTMGRRRPLGLGLLLALAVEPPMLQPFLSAAPQVAVAAKPSLPAAAGVVRPAWPLNRPASAAEQARDQRLLPPPGLKALLTWGPLSVAQEPASRPWSPD